jgi:PAS domain S-box-containing protein
MVAEFGDSTPDKRQPPGGADSERQETHDEPADLSADDAAARLHATRQKLGLLLERVSDAFVALDANWHYTYVNERAAALFGRRPEDLLGRHIWTEFPEGVGQPFHLAYEKAMAEQVFVEIEAYYEPWDRWFENRIYPSPEGVCIFFHDITARKMVEQAAIENAALLAGQKEVLESIASGKPLEETLEMLLRVIEARTSGMRCSILLPDAHGVRVRRVIAPSLPEPFTTALVGSCGAPPFATEPVVVEDVATHPVWDAYRDVMREANLRGCWSTPILDAHDKLLGTFALYFDRPGGPTERDRNLIAVATHTASIAIYAHNEAEARRLSEERLRLAITGGNVGVWELEAATKRLAWSDNLGAIFGWPPDADLTVRRVLDAVHPNDRERFEQALQYSLAHQTDFDVECRIVRPDGTQRWIAIKAALHCDAERKPLRTMGVAIDVTARKRAEEELTKREAQLAEAQRIAHVGSYEVDVRERTVSWSAELRRIFGLADGAVPATIDDYVERVHPEDRERVRQTLKRSFIEHTPFDFEHRIVRPDGSIRLLHKEGAWKFENGQPVTLMGVCQDITERRRAEQHLHQSKLLRDRNEELKAFAYTVSHDLKAPLRGIAGYAEELQRRHSDRLGERAQFCVVRILAATHSLNRLIDDLLRYSRLDAEVPTESEIDLARMVDGILREWRPAIAERHAEVDVRLSVSTVRGWDRGVRQVLSNLVDNALKYSRYATPPRVQIASAKVDGTMRISVTDNGIGFEMKQHDRIFGLFNRLVSDEEFEGTGAGLAIVKKLVEKMGGRLSAESAPGQGATFHVELPDQAESVVHERAAVGGSERG